LAAGLAPDPVCQGVTELDRSWSLVNSQRSPFAVETRIPCTSVTSAQSASARIFPTGGVTSTRAQDHDNHAPDYGLKIHVLGFNFLPAIEINDAHKCANRCCLLLQAALLCGSRIQSPKDAYAGFGRHYA
jgi:hypothetical protein